MRHTFSPSEAIKTGWHYTKKYFWTIMKLWAITYLPSLIVQLLTVIMMSIPWATEIVINPLTNLPEPQLIGIYATISIVISLIGAIATARLWIGLIRSYLMILEDQKPVIKDLYVSSSYLVRLIWSGLLYAVAVMLGFICFIIPGIYVALRLSQYKYYIAEWYGVIDSLKASRAVTKDTLWKLIGFWFICFGLMILWIITLWIGLIWILPTVVLGQLWIYTQLKKNTPKTFKAIE